MTSQTCGIGLSKRPEALPPPTPPVTPRRPVFPQPECLVGKLRRKLRLELRWCRTPPQHHCCALGAHRASPEEHSEA
ncbi:hypothetical protein E2C01_094035 [Portunus trituberculatus]|uniref:Uncharacterized protein n=1 Tax=Portunus trituberculatus TaxID=210409 RepID=A0A5B7JZR9_PORTR|nr:hypothetical protein [Portunus trituberculatus]